MLNEASAIQTLDLRLYLPAAGRDIRLPAYGINPSSATKPSPD
jgi:hypothetical protein